MANLYEIPTLPNEIKDAAKDNRLVLFVGAGASRLLGCPSWDGMADGALNALATAEIISFGDIARLSELDAKKKLSIAVQIAKESPFKIDYAGLLKTNESMSTIYQHLNSIGCPYVTTNYDLLAKPLLNSAKDATAPSINRYFHPKDFLAGRLRQPGTVIHLHGCLVDTSRMIITTSQYLSHYEDDYVKEFLGELFEKHTVLFVGYGLEEAEILEHILRKGKVSSQSERQRFLLQGFYSDQEKLFEWMQRYYQDSFGVHLQGFLLDRRNYSQLEHVVQDWASKITVGNPSIADDAAFIKEVISE